ncbi:hypothetical protein [Streptomyces sp. NPDC057702]|uniref:hypothetical protein n=1 Tax=unclassified Streptomyces TaxID=2593676 RepID=UPI0036C56369
MRGDRRAEVERATRDLCDALARLEALGQAPYPVGSVPGRGPGPALAGWGERGILLPRETLIWSPPSGERDEPGMWLRWPHEWTAPRHRL